MSDAPTDPFSPEVSAAVTAHMNGDHLEDNLLIARSLGGQPDGHRRRDDRRAARRAPRSRPPSTAHRSRSSSRGSRPVTDRGAIRVEVVRMYHEACGSSASTPAPGRRALMATARAARVVRARVIGGRPPGRDHRAIFDSLRSCSTSAATTPHPRRRRRAPAWPARPCTTTSPTRRPCSGRYTAQETDTS